MRDKIFLLNTEEADELPLKILRVREWWWLRSSGDYEDRAAGVYDVGALSSYGHGVDDDCCGVRPAILLDGTEEIEKLGDMIHYLGIEWHDISKYLGKPVLLAKHPIYFRRFDSKSNDYEKSEIRQYLLDWLKEKENEN